MSSLIQLDPDRLEQLAERLEHDAGTVRRIRHELAGLPAPAAVRGLVEQASALAEDVDRAADGTALLARRIVRDATGADRFESHRSPRPLLGGRLGFWYQVGRHAAAPTIDWSSIEDPADLRAMLESLVERHGADAWKLIPEDVRTRLIETCPELVAKLIVVPGGAVSSAELDALLEALAVKIASDKYSGSVDGRIPLELDVLATLGLGVTVEERSDGTVVVTVTGKLASGVGLSTKSKGTGNSASIDGTLGVTDSMTFEFDSMEEAEAAVDDLCDVALKRLPELVKPKSFWEQMVDDIPGGDLVVGANRVYNALTADDVKEALSRHGRHLDRVESEMTLGSEAAGSIKLPSIVKLSASATRSVSVYFSQEVHGPDDYMGVKAEVELSGSGMAAVGDWVSGSGLTLTGSAKASGSVDYRIGTDGEQRLIIKVNGEATGALGGGRNAVPSPGGKGSGTKTSPAIDVEVSDEKGRAASLVIEIPIDESTIDAADDLVDAVAHGEDPRPALSALYDEADITFTVESTESESVGVSAGSVASGEVGHERRDTTDVRRKRPHGEWHQPLDILKQLDD